MENEKYGILIEGGNGYAVYDKNGNLTISWPTGIADVPVYRPLDQADYQEFKDGKRTMSDLSFKA
ncbi:hypothetical protein, partial [Pseudolactococcus hodotermopsidis]|uniref:hypothetical protein n=1 Tax=Pseudolactococcus hodotermopsidis TaxID=2709157 RepID=UPI001E52AEA2